ncbi:MAG: N-succinylarginine dihydrolase [Legionella sp.]|uniref:N-succinylarginine dihydrolase n=1 Tax=Legionella sp. TaxID=459 RepID=UPI0039E5685D
MNTVYELNLDGLVGPTHNYAGLAAGNIASTSNALTRSNPLAAAKQGLKKMRFLHQLGFKQGVLPPHQRPNLKLLHQLGFRGSITDQLQNAYKTAPELLGACYSASSMWTANAATVTPSLDAGDGKTHFTTANLINNLHRHQEADFSSKLLQLLFANPDYFIHHEILPRSTITSDEGAANHSRICQNHAQPGIHLFVYGKKAFAKNGVAPVKYPARQTREASEIIVRNHQLSAQQVILAQQNPQAIDQGVFHNDVISVANESLFLVHEQAFLNQKKVLQELRNKAAFSINIIEISQHQLNLTDAVESYLFNSQILTLPHQQQMILVAPGECEHNLRVKTYIDSLIAETTNPINAVHFIDLRQSMRNGGGPACLRLRVPLNTQELDSMHQGILVNDYLLDTLEQWVEKYYRSELTAIDLTDPQLINESMHALDELTQILNIGSIYPFQSEVT